MLTIPVFYTPKQVAADNVSRSPSAGKPALVVESWRQFPIEIMEPTPATPFEFALAHDQDHVAKILACKKSNGFNNRLPSVAASLPYTSGSMLSAARFLLQTGGLVAASPTSGFHHAGYARCEGFCTLNGLMVTAWGLRHDGFQGRIGILDCDEHYGNGTLDIITQTGFENIHHYTYGGEQPESGQDWLIGLESVLETFQDCDLILYQAGADPHRNDPFSRGLLDDAQLAIRDHTVFNFFRCRQIPVVWNLAGGYQEPIRKVLDIHDETMRACCAAYLGA